MQTLAELLHAKPGELGSWNGIKIYAIDAKKGDVLKDIGGGLSHDPASLTKLMTFYIAARAITQHTLDTDEKLTVLSRYEALPPSNKKIKPNKYDTKPGREYSIHELMNAMMTASDNNATYTLAQTIGERLHLDIVSHMNDEAVRIGMVEKTKDGHIIRTTHFKNVDGWPIKTGEGNRTTAHDMAVLMQRIQVDYPKLTAEYMGQKGVNYDNRYHPAHQWLNNPASGMALMPSFNVLAKTGYTDASRHNIDSYITFPDGRPMIMVILGSGNKSPEFARALNVPEKIIKAEVKKNSHPGLVGGNRIRDALVRELVDQLVATWQPELVIQTPDPLAQYHTPIVMKQDGTVNRDPLFLQALKAAELHAIKEAGEVLRATRQANAPLNAPKPQQKTGQER